MLCLLILLTVATLFAKSIEIISFNDFHGALKEDTYFKGKNVGMAKFVTAIKKLEKTYRYHTVLVAGGDNYQGSAMSILTKGKPVSEMFKELHVAASAVGNHEFDWGIKYFKIWGHDGDFPFLAANIINKKTRKSVTWAKPYFIVEKDGVKIAFIGLATIETPFTTAKKNIENLTFTDPVKATRHWIDFLKAGKAKEGKPDVIIALTHIPSFQNKPYSKITGPEINVLCRETKGLDAVISAHSHKIVCGYINHIPVIQAGSHGQDLGVLKITLNKNCKLEKITPFVLRIYKEKNRLKEDKKASEIYKKYLKKIKHIDKVIGKARTNLFNNFNNGITSLSAWATKTMVEQTGAQVAVINSTALRGGIRAGNIALLHMYNVMPFENTIVTMKVSGKDLKRIVGHRLPGLGQFYGLEVHYDSKISRGNKIVSMSLLNGKPVEMNKYYTLASLDFLYNGGSHYDFSGAKDVKFTGITLRDMLIKDIKDKKIISPPNTSYLIDIASQQKAA